MMRVLFLGTPAFAAAHLEALLAAGVPVAGVVTQPDRPAGRGGKLVHAAVKQVALRHGLPLFQPPRLRRPEVIAELAALQADLTVVVAFGQILSREALQLSRLGSLNVHASLLPRWRGADPIRRAVMAGDAVTGVTTMWMDEGMDTGDMILKQEVPLGPDETAGDLYERLVQAGPALLLETLRQVAAGMAPRVPQPAEGVTYAPKLKPEDEVIDWRRPAREIVNQVRALNPFPGAYTEGPGGRLKIWRAAVHAQGEAGIPPAGIVPGAARAAPPGTVGGLLRQTGFLVAAGDGAVLVQEVQPENGRKMEAWAYLLGRRIEPGARLGDGAGGPI